MKFSSLQRDRAAGVLVGQACGDALGVPYEFATAPTAGDAVMKGGGLGPYAPGEWSDDTQMAICIAEVAAGGARLTDPHSLDAIGAAFAGWMRDGASDIGAQTAAVLSRAGRIVESERAVGREPGVAGWGDACTEAAREHARTHARSAGNGALMRNAVVGLSKLDDRAATAAAARAIARLTHADPLAEASCVLQGEAIRRAVLDGDLDLHAGLDLLPARERSQWVGWIEEAEISSPRAFADNGFTVRALQAAWWAITHTAELSGTPRHFGRALHAAVSVGHDTDTVAAITGALVGVKGQYGYSSVPALWRRAVHGWPGMRADRLAALGLTTAEAGLGSPENHVWPNVSTMRTGAARLGTSVPGAPELVLGTETDLQHVLELGCDAVVSLSRIGSSDRAPVGVEARNHIEQWLIDSERPEENFDLAWALHDASDAVHILASEGHKVLLHCVRADNRTPAVALLYLVKHRGMTVHAAVAALEGARPFASVSQGLLWSTAMDESEHVVMNQR